MESRRFLVVGMQRSGTTVTQAQLIDHPEVAIARQEIAATCFWTSVLSQTSRGETCADRSRSVREVLDHLAGHRPGVAATGLKTALPSAGHAARLAGCLRTHAPDLALIVVRRNDLVAQFGSLRRAQATGTWHSSDRQPSQHDLRVAFTRDELAAYVQDCVDCDRLLESIGTGRPVLALDYERDVATGGDRQQIAAFLGIDARRGTPARLRKVSPDANAYIDDYASHRAALPELLAAAQATPAPAPVEDPTESRVFLLHRAGLRLAQGNAAAAVDDATAALHAPAEWQIDGHGWACDLLAEALFRLDSPARARALLATLAELPTADGAVVLLQERIAARLIGR